MCHVTPRSVVVAAVLVLAVVTTAPAFVAAQPASRVAKIGFLTATTEASVAPLLAAFKQGLREVGYVEGKTVALEGRYAEARFERLPELARELVGLKPDVIVATTDPAIAAVKRETRTIPIVMAISADPAGTGLVASLARPGGNVTGLTTISPQLSGKRLELLREAIPGLSRVAFLWNPDVRGNLLEYKETEGAARSLHVELLSIEVSRIEDLDRTYSTLTKERPQAVIIPQSNPVVVTMRTQVMGFAQRDRLPTMSGGVRGRRRPHVLRAQLSRHVLARGHLRRQDPERREAGRSSRGAADHVRAGDQPEDGESHRPDHSAVAPPARRSGRPLAEGRGTKEDLAGA